MEAERKNNRWVNPILAIIALLCFVPLFVYLVEWMRGIPFHLQWVNVAELEGQATHATFGEIGSKSVFLYLLHIFDWIEFFCGLFIVISLYFYFGVKREIGFPLVGLTYFFAGFIHIFLDLTLDQFIIGTAQNRDVGSMAWFISDASLVLFLILTLTAAIFVRKKGKEHSWAFLIGATSIGVVIALFLSSMYFYQPTAVKLVFPSYVVKHPFHLALFCLALFVVLPLAYNYFRNEKTIFSKFVFVSVFPLIAGQAYAVFEPHYLFATFGWIQILGVLCYLLPLTGALFTNLDLYLILKRGRELAQEAIEAKTHFMATVSHQLRTPMNAILGFSHCLLDGLDGELSEQQKTSVSKILKAGNSLMTLINGVLDVSLLESKEMRFITQVFNPLPLLKKLYEGYRDVVQQKKIAFEILPAIREVEMSGDQERFRQVLAHLVSNAVKFTETGGITIKLDLAARHYVFEVVDTGKGIVNEDLENIFTPFGMTKVEQKYIVHGRGFGLALAKKIAEQHGGMLSAESQLGKGSRFTLMLPYESYIPDGEEEESFTMYVIDKDTYLSDSVKQLKAENFCSSIQLEMFSQNRELFQKHRSMVLINYANLEADGEKTELENVLFRKGMQILNLIPKSIPFDFSLLTSLSYDEDYEEAVHALKKRPSTCRRGEECELAIIGDLPYENARLAAKLRDLCSRIDCFELNTLQIEKLLEGNYQVLIFCVHFSNLLFPKLLNEIKNNFIEKIPIFYCSPNQSFIGHKNYLFTGEARDMLVNSGVEIVGLTGLLNTYIEGK